MQKTLAPVSKGERKKVLGALEEAGYFATLSSHFNMPTMMPMEARQIKAKTPHKWTHTLLDTNCPV